MMGDEQEQRTADFRRLLDQMNDVELREVAALIDASKALDTVREAIAAVGLSQYVNTIFAAYVAVDAEQYRLGDLATPEADAAADALGDKALALAVELDGIEDYSGNADLAAARSLHELMLLTRWNRLDQVEWDEDCRDHLAVVAALAGATTGAVRVEARRVMATKGVAIPDEAADPLVELVAAYRARIAAEDAMSDGELDAHDRANGGAACPAFERLRNDPPAAISLAGVEAVLRLVVAEDARDRDWHRPGLIERAVLPFFDRRAAR